MNGNRSTWMLAALLALTFVASQVARPVAAPHTVTFESVPMALSAWAGQPAPPLEPETAKILAADQYVHRYYAEGSRSIEMDIAYYAQPHVGGTAHSPLNCLPGNGWTMSEPRVREVQTSTGTWSVREITVSRDNAHWAMTYWFQNRQRIEADEFAARWNLFTDAVRRRPADTAMVRVMTPITPGDASGHEVLAAFTRELIPQVDRAFRTAS